MKHFKILLSLLALAFITSCGNGQKPSDRIRYQNPAEADSLYIRVSYDRPTETSTPEVQVELNGSPFKMLWDTGATTTCISTLELVNMIKNGTISESDRTGSVSITVADGSTVAVPTFNIREVVLRGTSGEVLRVNNVDVVVMDNPSASLLLGQNIMKELPAYTFDDICQELVFKK